MMLFRPSRFYFYAAALAALADMGRVIKFQSSLPPMTYTGPRPSTKHQRSRSKYDPHQGKRECARRVRQMERRAA